MDLPNFANLKPVSLPSTGQPNFSALQPGVFQPKSTSPFNPNSQNSQFVQPNSPQQGIGFGGAMSAIGEGFKGIAKALTDPIKGGINEVANDTSQAFQGGLQQSREGVAQIANTNGNPMDLISGVGKFGAGFIQGVTSPFAAGFKPVGKVLDATANKIAENPTIQKFSNTQAGQTTAHIAGDVANYSNIAGAVGGFMDAPNIANKGQSALSKVTEPAKPGVMALKNDISAVGNKVVDTAQKVDTRLGGQASESAIQANKIADTAKSSATAGQIVQGDIADIPKAQKALSQIDVSKVKTYQDLAGTLDSKIKDISSLQDKAFDTRPENIHINDLTSQGHNYVNDAISQMKEFYSKVNDVQGLKDITNLENKANTQGLTIKEVNQLARDHGATLNAYNANGELASGLTKQAAENTRQGVKSTVRTFMGNEAIGGSDAQLSDLIKTKDLVKQVSEKVNDLSQKIKERGLGEKIGYYGGKVVNTIGAGSPKGLIEYFLGRGTGLKTLNALDLEKTLQANLKNLQKLTNDKISNADFTAKLNEIIKNGTTKK